MAFPGPSIHNELHRTHIAPRSLFGDLSSLGAGGDLQSVCLKM